MAKIDWRGEQVKKRVRNAQKFGVDKTMAQCVEHAKNNHKWHNQTGIAEGSIRITNFAHPHGFGYRGVWGSADVVYFRRLELGFQGVDAIGRSFDQAPLPILRPTADAIYPNLPANVAEGMKK